MEVYACGASVQVQLRSQASVLADTLARVAPASSSYVRSKDFVTTPRQSRACILTISTFSLLLGSTTLTFRLRTVPLECRCAPDLPFYRPSWSPSGDCLMVTTVTEYEDQYVHVRAELFSVGGHILRRYDSQEYTRCEPDVRNLVQWSLNGQSCLIQHTQKWLDLFSLNAAQKCEAHCFPILDQSRNAKHSWLSPCGLFLVHADISTSREAFVEHQGPTSIVRVDLGRTIFGATMTDGCSHLEWLPYPKGPTTYLLSIGDSASMIAACGHQVLRHWTLKWGGPRASVVRNPVRHMLRVSPISVHLRAVWLHDGRGLILWVPGKANDSDAVTFRPLPIEF